MPCSIGSMNTCKIPSGSYPAHSQRPHSSFFQNLPIPILTAGLKDTILMCSIFSFHAADDQLNLEEILHSVMKRQYEKLSLNQLTLEIVTE